MEERKDICEGYERDSVQQLDKLAKDKNERFPIYPLTYIQAVYDARTKERLDSILWKCNNVYLPWMGSAGDTRIQLPFWMRRKGIIITYKNLEDETITEKLTYDLCIADDFFRLDSSWTRITDALPVGGNITIGSNGNWFQDGVDTGFKAQGPKGDNGLTPMLRTVNNKLQYSYDGEVWNEISEYIAAWFRFQDNKIQISRDQKTWSDLSKPFTQDLYIKGYVATSSALPSTGVKQGDIYMVGPTYAAEDTEHKNPIYRMYVYNDSGWRDNGVFQSIAAGVVQTIGNSETEVMSQKAVSSIVGLDTYPVFSDTKPYVKGEIVNYGGLLYEFTADHEAGAWIGTDARDTSLRGEVRNIDNSIMEYNVSMHNDWSKYTLVEAIALVPNRLRRLGQKVSFINSLTGLAETWMYIGTDSNEWGVTNFVASDAGFYGQIFDTLESPYNIDNIKSTGFYIKKNGNPYILIVKAEKGAEIYQVRFYVPDFTDKVVLGKRKYSTSTNSWTSWVNQEIITQDLLDALSSTIYSFDGFIETNDSDADNFIDKVTTTGVYKRAKNGYPIIYFVKTVNGIVYQTQFYYNDSLTLVFKVRRLNSGVWTEWSNQTFVFDIGTFKFSELDNLNSYGTYISSETYNNGILYVMKSSPYLLGYDMTQILFLNDVNSGRLKKGVRHHETGANWMDWGWEEVDDTTLQKQIAKTGISFNLTNYNQYQGYISQRDLTVNANEGYRTISIPLTDIPEGQKYLTIPCQGGAILLVGYWKGDYNDSSNYLGRDSITAFSQAGSQMYENVPLHNLIPDGATHMTLCWNIVGYPKLTIYNPDLNPSSGGGNVRGIILPSTYLGQREVVYGGMNNAYLYKRGALLNIAGNHDDLIIVAGQSNADGRADKSEAPQWLIDMNYKIENYMMWNPIAEQFQPWELGVNTGSEDNASNQFGFDIYFAKKYLEANPAKKLYVVKQSIGGTPISPLRASGEIRAYCWTPMPELITDGGTSMCNLLIEKIRKAYLYASSNNINLAIQALLWHQGEADMTEIRASYFEDNLKGLLSWMRGIWAAPALPIINGQISSYYDTEFQPTYSANKTFATLNGIDPYFKTVNMKGQAMQPDNVHFAAGGYEHMGYGMWNYYLEFNPIYKPNSYSMILSNVVYKDSIPTD